MKRGFLPAVGIGLARLDVFLKKFEKETILMNLCNLTAKYLISLLPTGGGGGFLARTIRLLTITLKWLCLAPPNLVTFSFYLLDTFWQNFSKIDSPGELLQLFLK